MEDEAAQEETLVQSIVEVLGKFCASYTSAEVRRTLRENVVACVEF